MTRGLRAVALLLVLAVASTTFARVLSYSPYTNRVAMPAFQARGAGEFVLVEQSGTQFVAPMWLERGEVVVYDAVGSREPRVIFPEPGVPLGPISYAAYAAPAAGGPGHVLIETNSNFQGKNANFHTITLIGDATGSNWKRVSQLDGASALHYDYEGSGDLGGYFTRGLGGTARPVTSSRWIFVVDVTTGLWGVDAAGQAKRLVNNSGSYTPILIGSDANASRVLVQNGARYAILDLNTETLTDLGAVGIETWGKQGWVAGPDRAYVLTTTSEGRKLMLYRRGMQPQFIAGPAPLPGTPSWSRDRWSFLAAPTHDYAGAWMVQRDVGQPTTLYRHTETGGLKQFWSDITGPQVEALHAGRSGERVLVQVHRPRVQPERWFIDPALAIWKVGDPAPRDYEELFLNETPLKGFVHLDVDAVANGASFVFDSGLAVPAVSRTSPPISGGGDVVQEWGVVRSAFKQELVLPGVARLPGAFNSYWQSDVVIYNPVDAQAVIFRFAPLDADTLASTTITLAAKEIRVIKDVLKELFAIEAGGGSLHIEPSVGVSATGRTYSSTAEGSFGFSMAALDSFTAAGTRFPLSFAGAFPGTGTRTNILLTAPKGLTAAAKLQAYGVSGEMGGTGVTLATIGSGVWQMNNVQSVLSLSSHQEGGLVITPTNGFVIPAVVTIDNITNDPTYFPPDLPAPVVRTIPVIGHLDGANNSKFRSDLYLINTSTTVQTVTLEAKAWDRNEPAKTISFTLLPNEDRVIREALPRLFNMTGFARLRYQSQGADSNGVRVTSRTYNVREDGGTLGCIIPPLNSFQSAASGESLEILGVVGGSGFRANIGLVELSPNPNPNATNNVRIEIVNDRGVQIDSFQVTVPAAGGMQINDIFNARGLTAPKAALIRIKPTGPGLIGAYATLTDNGTNDPSFLAASLGATQ